MEYKHNRLFMEQNKTFIYVVDKISLSTHTPLASGFGYTGDQE